MRLLLLIFFLPIFVGAETASITNLGLPGHTSPAAINATCESLKRNVNCQVAKDFVTQVTGFTESNCRAEQSSPQCRALIASHSEFRGHEMKCNFNEACKLAQADKWVEGCADYGIDVVQSLFPCKDLTCALEQQAKMSLYFLFASYSLAHAAPNVIPQVKASIEKLRDDFRTRPLVHCLDPETRAKFQCYMLVKYGGAAIATVTTVGSAAAIGARLMTEMGALDAEMSAGAVTATERAAVSVPKVPRSPYVGLPVADVDTIPKLESTLSKNFGQQVTIRPRGRLTNFFDVIGQDGKALGEFTYRVTGNDLKIDVIDLPGAKGQGGSRAILQHILQKHPEVSRISADLLDDNRLAFKQAREAGASCLKALMSTPAYKIRAASGFARIAAYSCDADSLHMTVTR